MIHSIDHRWPLMLGVLAAIVFCGPLAAAAEPQQDQVEEARRKQGLKNMQRAAARYALSAADTPQRAFQFHETAALRFSNPVSGTNDGALYLWTNHGRPQALLKFYTSSHKAYTHVWLSLSENNFVAERDGKVVWSPNEPGIKMLEIQGAPEPAETATKRLRQMRTLSAEFSATYTATHLRERPFELRLLTQPLLRYETDDEYRADGALFAFVQSTAPVGLLLLESRQIQDGHRWHYACASLVAGQLAARYLDKEVFFLDRNNTARDPKQPFVMFHALPVPKE
jgi:hypothetical protein